MFEELEARPIAQDGAEPLGPVVRKPGETPRQQIRKTKVVARRQFSAEEKIRIELLLHQCQRVGVGPGTRQPQGAGRLRLHHCRSRCRVCRHAFVLAMGHAGALSDRPD